LGLKDLVKKIVSSAKQARDLAENKKAVKYLNKIEDIESAIAMLEKRKHSAEIANEDNNEV
jgi:hypothetical protein